MGVVRLFARALVVSALVAVPVSAGAQYFGRNKVEYGEFRFQILATEHFDVYFYPREEPAARMAGQLAERWYARYSALLHHQFDHRQPLVMYGSQAEFAQTNVVSGLLPDSVGGVTDSTRRRIVMPFAPTLAETNRVLGHEIVHAFQFDIARTGGGDTMQPLWFIEGMAEYLARGSLDVDSSLWLRDAVAHDRLPKDEAAASRSMSPYLYGHAFWAYLGRTYGDSVVEKALKPPRKQGRLKNRMRAATGKDLPQLYLDWRNDAMRRFESKAEADRLKPWQAETMQLGPSLSPDGTQVVFFSERDRLSLDLYLADVASGRVVRKLATTAASAKFDSLQPLRSSGAWSPDGEWFAFAAVRQGKAALMLIDLTGQHRDREWQFDDLGQVLSPSWSPDGRSIVMSALAGGFTDLYLCDVATGTLSRLTDDAFADLQPAWSHDGRRVAFVTERYSSNWATMTFGRTQLAILDLDSRQIHQVPVSVAGAQLDPHWSADDRSLVFVADSGGTMNVFRADESGDHLQRLTAARSGVAGIAPTSPSLTLSAGASAIAFTVFDRGRPHLVVRSSDVATTVQSAAAQVSEADMRDGSVDAWLADHASGLAAGASPNIHGYASRLSLEGVGQPYLTSGGGPFGTFVRGGGALLFGDMLGDRRLGAAIQVGNHLRDAAFAFRFLNQERRWNWGLQAQLEPSVVRYRRAEAVTHEERPAWLFQNNYFERTDVRAGAFVAYPFSRGLRVEFSGGVHQSLYNREQRTQVASVATGQVLASTQSRSTGGAATTLGEAGAALVRDTTVYGPTGPLLGSRYRLEVAPTIGALSFTSVTADVRKYFMPVRPYTVALRVLHAARYGADGNDPRLLSTYLGSNYFVRGHRNDMSYCLPVEGRACGDDLFGNRLLVGNVELRVPLWGIRSRQLDYGPLPIDVIAFADSGIVWNGSSRSARITSAGAGVRVNALGMPIEITATRAADGPRPRWMFEFGFKVGY